MYLQVNIFMFLLLILVLLVCFNIYTINTLGFIFTTSIQAVSNALCKVLVIAIINGASYISL